MTSPFDRLGQQLERALDPIAFDNKARIDPQSVHPDLRSNRRKHMTKETAIKLIKEVQSGSGPDRTKFPEKMKGDIAKDKWHDSTFSYGMEYGYILGLMEAFNITVEDLHA